MKLLARLRSKPVQRASLLLVVVMPFALYYAMSNDHLALAAAALAVMAGGMLLAVLNR